jgi:hypothetical protein
MRLDQIPLNPPQSVFQEPRYLRPSRYQVSQERLGRTCPACGATAGQPCDGSRIATFEGMHFARHEGFQWPPPRSQ